MTDDRMSEGYQPDWDIDLAVGRQGELYVARIVEAMRTGASIEVKTDDAAVKWGRVYLEYRCLRRDGWAPSGLATTNSELWATVLAGDVAVIAPTWRYKQAARAAWHNPGLRKELNRGSHPTRGIVIPLGSLLRNLMDAPPENDPAKPWDGTS